MLPTPLYPLIVGLSLNKGWLRPPPSLFRVVYEEPTREYINCYSGWFPADSLDTLKIVTLPYRQVLKLYEKFQHIERLSLKLTLFILTRI